MNCAGKDRNGWLVPAFPLLLMLHSMLLLRVLAPIALPGGRAFRFMDPNDLKSRDTRFAEFLERRAEVLPWIKEYSPIECASADDPPIHLIYGVKLQEKLQSLGVPCERVYPGSPEMKHKTIELFLINTLKK